MPAKRFWLEGLDKEWFAEQADYFWNGHPVPLMTTAVCAEVFEAIGEDPPEPWEGVKPIDGLCWQIDGEVAD